MYPEFSTRIHPPIPSVLVSGTHREAYLKEAANNQVDLLKMMETRYILDSIIDTSTLVIRAFAKRQTCSKSILRSLNGS